MFALLLSKRLFFIVDDRPYKILIAPPFEALLLVKFDPSIIKSLPDNLNIAPPPFLPVAELFMKEEFVMCVHDPV